MDNTTPEGKGYLQVKVSSANGAVPEEGASVMIYDYPDEGSGKLSELITVLKTDSSGQTPKIELPAPPRSQSQTPGGGKPYSAYNIEVSKDGFYNVEGVGAPVFDGITSVQPINLIPKSGVSISPSEGIQILEAPVYDSLREERKGRLQP